MSKNILVSGCGGDIAQSIGKILRQSSLVNKLYGCDLHLDHAGIFIFDECFIVPPASSKEYLDNIRSIIEKYEIDILIPSTEYELRFFLKNKSPLPETLVILKANDRALETGLDKYATAQFLKNEGFPFLTTHLITEKFAPDFPCIIKSRTGSGSKSVHHIQDQEMFVTITKIVKDAICQEYVDSNDGYEFTSGLFRGSDKVTRSITFKRRLSGGFSSFGSVVKNPVIDQLMNQIAEALDLRGSINAQFRMKAGSPKVFEINPRFSSTVCVRHLLGFEDVIWSLQDRLGIPVTTYTEPREGSRFYKGFMEYITP